MLLALTLFVFLASSMLPAAPATFASQKNLRSSPLDSASQTMEALNLKAHPVSTWLALPARIPAANRERDADAARKAPRAHTEGALTARALAEHVKTRAARRGYFAAPPKLFPAGSSAQEKLWAAARHYWATGEALSVVDGQTLVLPYRKKQDVIVTDIFHFTLLQLAPGEYSLHTMIAGGKKWVVETAEAGTPQDFTQVISIRPEKCGLRSNMVITTNQGRLYELQLESLPCDLEAGVYPEEGKYTKHVRLWYPDGSGSGEDKNPLQHLLEEKEGDLHLRPEPPRFEGKAPAFAQQSEMDREASTDPLAMLDLRTANTNYEIDVDRRFPCPPDLVADEDGIMYIRFPKNQPLCRQRYPLFVEGENRDLQLVNYQVFDGNVYKVEGTPLKTVLMYRTEGGRERRVEIVNQEIQAALRRR